VKIPLVVSDIDTTIAQLQFTGTSSNPNLVSGVSFTPGTGNDVLATVNLVAGASGFAAVTISVSDGTTPVSRDFALEVKTASAQPKLSVSLSGDVLTVTLAGTPGNYVVQRTTNFATWTDVANVTIGSNGTGVTTVPTAGLSSQFLRAKSL
jgi:hypothetical protein